MRDKNGTEPIGKILNPPEEYAKLKNYVDIHNKSQNIEFNIDEN